MATKASLPHNIYISTQSKNHSFITRFFWFVFIGWWLSSIFMLLGLIGIASIFLAPLGFWFINRVPQVQTLRSHSTHWEYAEREGATYISERNAQQHPWYLRLLYLPVGFVLGLVWLSIAWLVSLLIITLPLSIWMIDRSPAIITLEKN